MFIKMVLSKPIYLQTARLQLIEPLKERIAMKHHAKTRWEIKQCDFVVINQFFRSRIYWLLSMKLIIIQNSVYWSFLELNRQHDLFSKDLQFHFTVTVVNNERICDTFDCPDVTKQAASETQVISFSDDVPNIEIECNSCISNLHKRVSHSSMIHISSFVNMTKERFLISVTGLKLAWWVKNFENSDKSAIFHVFGIIGQWFSQKLNYIQIQTFSNHYLLAPEMNLTKSDYLLA